MSRIKALRAVVFITFSIIFVQLFLIQIVHHDDYVAKAAEQHTLLETIVAKRGEIYMMDNNEPVPVVLNQTVYSVIIDPSITNKDQLTEALNHYASEYIVADINQVFSTEGLRYYIIARNVPYSVANQIAEEGIAGIWFQESNQRVYPEGEMASGLLGFVNSDGLGQYGVEGSLNEQLAGKNGLLKTVSDVNNIALSIGNDNIKIPAQNGKNIVLSVDRGLERGIEEIASEAINSTPATNASVLVMNTKTNEVLSMANLPNYDPKNYGFVKDASAYINNVTEAPYEPASICKSFAFSAAINEGKMNATTTYFNQHYDIVDDWKIENAEKRASLYGEIDMRTGFYWSLNSSSIKALKLLGDDANNINQKGREALYDYYYNKFRLGRYTGIELIELPGYIPDPNEGYGRNSTYANMTFGQNLSITMLQTATAFSAVVNGGYYRTPTIVKGTFENQTLKKAEREDIIEEQILSSETSATMRELLVHNRDYKVKGGIDPAGYDIGGKSGTAQVVIDGSYDNTMSNLVGSYIGFIAPSGEMPEYLIMIRMWGEGQAIDSGEAGRLFDKLSNFLINYLKIKPNNGV